MNTRLIGIKKTRFAKSEQGTVCTFFKNFDDWADGQVITANKDVTVVLSRNPHGSHNLVLCRKSSDFSCTGLESIRHGNKAVLETLKEWGFSKLHNKVLKKLKQKKRK